MKKYLTTGLVILLPILLTVMIISFLINFLTNPFLNTTEALFNHFNLFNHSFLFLNSEQVLRFSSKVAILLFLVGFIYLIGILGRLFLIEYFLKLGDSLFRNVPIVNKIYKACQDVVNGLFSSKSKSFSQVVLVPFPSKDALSIGLVTKGTIHIQTHVTEFSSLETIPVFVPGTPNPSVGFMLLFKREQLILIDMKIEEAMKFVVSCGVVMSEFGIMSSDSKNSNSVLEPLEQYET